MDLVLVWYCWCPGVETPTPSEAKQLGSQAHLGRRLLVSLGFLYYWTARQDDNPSSCSFFPTMKGSRVNPAINIDSTEDDTVTKQGDDSAPVSRRQFNKLVVQVEQLQTQMLQMSSVIAHLQGANTDNGISVAAAAEVESAVTTLEEALSLIHI